MTTVEHERDAEKEHSKNGDALTMSVEDAAKALGISRGLAYRMASSGELPGTVRLGRRLLIIRRVFERGLGLEEVSGTKT